MSVDDTEPRATPAGKRKRRKTRRAAKAAVSAAALARADAITERLYRLRRFAIIRKTPNGAAAFWHRWNRLSKRTQCNPEVAADYERAISDIERMD